jgi:hypothetical protein
MEESVEPTTDEIRHWLLSSLRHSCQVEYYLHRLNLGQRDPQRPHDIVGSGSKYSWSVIEGLALQYRSDDPEFFERRVLPSIEKHRRNQYHHQKWNYREPPLTVEDMKVGAIDALCSLLDDRRYQNGSHTFEDIIYVIKKNDPYMVKWMWMVYSQMREIPAPDLGAIGSLHSFPNVGISEEMHRRAIELTAEAVEMLRREHRYVDL